MRILATVISLIFVTSSVLGQSPYTPKQGSSERQAICDAMRDFMKDHVAQKPLPKPIVFKIDTIRVHGDYCYFEGIPIFKDGSEVIGKYLPDIVSYVELKNGNAGWKTCIATTGFTFRIT